MKFAKLALAGMSFSLLVSGVAYAQDGTTSVIANGGTIHFQGEFVNAACAVSTGSSNQTVQMGQYRTAAFKSVGDTLTSVPFTISLSDCDSSIAKQAQVSFSGQLDATDKTLLALSGAGNESAAKGVALQILDSASMPVTPDGSTYSVAQNLIDGNNTLRFSASYKSTAEKVTAGQANADATFMIKYQ
ncbi:type-1 fimbrial protein subunit A [Izhakiella australiensis]|uniref:Type-1 fimbrial protein subunit A n=1 Tax=Izhakiella australiensis TaxID=1926881 RepID=A0A1S8YNR5_9GAMM|nr:type 1 fimbrial major subunit FimA [Izhakiella australiensis]OON40532.1 type-1 fimbrial protein subunit A [Izhakiella australiensis]